MKQVLVIVILSFVFTSCMTTTRYSKIVESKTKRELLQTNVDDDWITVKCVKTEPENHVCIQKKNTFIPALLYWEWNSTIECQLNIETRIEFLKQGIYKAADSLHLRQKLGSKKLEIQINEAPGVFLYENKGNAIIFLIAYTVSGYEGVSPLPINLEFDYSVNKDGEIFLEGEGNVQNFEQPLRNVWKSTKKFTWLYLDEFKKETERMGEEIVRSILDELSK